MIRNLKRKEDKMMKQKDAMRQAVQAGQAQGLAGDELRAFAVEQVKQGLMAGTVQHSKGPLPEDKAKSYASSLYNNWTKKDTAINETGEAYVPATKRGPQIKDERLKELAENLKSLKAHNVEPELIARVQTAFDARKAEVQAAKATTKVKSLEETLASLDNLGIVV